MHCGVNSVNKGLLLFICSGFYVRPGRLNKKMNEETVSVQNSGINAMVFRIYAVVRMDCKKQWFNRRLMGVLVYWPVSGSARSLSLSLPPSLWKLLKLSLLKRSVLKLSLLKLSLSLS